MTMSPGCNRHLILLNCCYGNWSSRQRRFDARSHVSDWWGDWAPGLTRLPWAIRVYSSILKTTKDGENFGKAKCTSSCNNLRLVCVDGQAEHWILLLHFLWQRTKINTSAVSHFLWHLVDLRDFTVRPEKMSQRYFCPAEYTTKPKPKTNPNPNPNLLSLFRFSFFG